MVAVSEVGEITTWTEADMRGHSPSRGSMTATQHQCVVLFTCQFIGRQTLCSGLLCNCLYICCFQQVKTDLYLTVLCGALYYSKIQKWEDNCKRQISSSEDRL